jgi:hypothetical protein
VSKELICGVKPPFSFGSVSTFHSGSGGGVDGIDDKGRVMMQNPSCFSILLVNQTLYTVKMQNPERNKKTLFSIYYVNCVLYLTCEHPCK